MNTLWQVIRLVVFVFLQRAYCEVYIGDCCVLKRTGEPGCCQLLENCPAAVTALQSSRIYPQICGFKGIHSIVCCPGKISGTPKSSQRSCAWARVGDKSKQKCEEYGKYVFENVAIAGPKSVTSEDCAITEIPLIAGGKSAKLREFPHMAAIGYDVKPGDRKWQCGGSLISEQFVLTAGHCLTDKQNELAKYIRLGQLHLDSIQDNADLQDFNVIDRFRHPSYIPPSKYNDIALLKMDRPAQLNTYVRPACLDTSSVFSTKTAVVTGWGKISYDGDSSNTLLKVTLEYFTHNQCSRMYKNLIGMKLKEGINDKIQICAGSHNASKDACPGDSGGPLQIVDKEVFCMYDIVGIVSFGRICGTIDVPGVYTRVSSYIEWIERIVWP